MSHIKLLILLVLIMDSKQIINDETDKTNDKDNIQKSSREKIEMIRNKRKYFDIKLKEQQEQIDNIKEQFICMKNRMDNIERQMSELL